ERLARRRCWRTRPAPDWTTLYRGAVSVVCDGAARARSPLLSVEIFRRAKLAGYPGGKSALYDLIQAIRPKTPRPVVRFEGLPGGFSPHDFGQVDNMRRAWRELTRRAEQDEWSYRDFLALLI